MSKSIQNFILALVIITFGITLLSIIVWRQFGGETTLGVIIGHVAAWVEMVVIYYFRKLVKHSP